MSVFSVFGASPPPGTYAVLDDGAPSIRLGQRFYRTAESALTSAASIIGGRVWIPSTPPGATGIRIMLWLPPWTIADEPSQSVVVPISGNGWHEGLFPSAAPIPAAGVEWRIGYEFVGNDDDYVFSPSLRPDAADNPIISAIGLALSSTRSLYRIGSGGEVSAGGFNVGYGIDTLVDDGGEPDPPNNPPIANAGPDQSGLTNQIVTLTGSGTDGDGTIIAYSWTQVSGNSVVLSGSGATRTFTPTSAGLRVFRLTVTDDDGATATDTVSVTTTAPEPPPQTGDAAERLNAALVGLTGCIGSAFNDLCTYGLISGNVYVPFDPDEDEADSENCDDYGCSQLWVRVESINAITPDSWDSGCSVRFSIELEVGIIRCFEIPEEGEAPTASAMLGYAMQSNEDMNRIFCAAMSCDEIEDEFDTIVAGAWLPLGPLGGQYGGTWSFTVETT